MSKTIIEYFGHSCVKIIGEKSVVVDPFKNIGYEQQQTECDYLLITHNHYDHSAKDRVDAKVVIDSLDKVKLAKDIYLTADVLCHDNKFGKLRGNILAYTFILGGIKFCHLGDVGEDFDKDRLKKFVGVDVLFLPVGGNYTIDYKVAKKYADYINPKIIIPIHFKTNRSDINIDKVDKFLSLFDSFDVVKSLEITKETLTDNKKVIVFDCARF